MNPKTSVTTCSTSHQRPLIGQTGILNSTSRFLSPSTAPPLRDAVVFRHNNHIYPNTRRVRGDIVSPARLGDDSLQPEGCGSRVIILECDSVLVDIHNSGHRRAFNMAFEEMGYSCSQWSAPIYYDLLRFGDSSGPGLVKTYYEMVGWPIMLSSADRGDFVEKIYATKERIFHELVRDRDIPLRQGVEEFVDDALKDGVHLVLLAATASPPGEGVADAVLDILGPDRASKIECLSAVKGDEEEEEQAIDMDDTMPLDQLLKQATGKGRVQSASSFVRAINLQSRGVGMRVDSTLFATSGSSVSPSYFAAIIAAHGASSASSAFVGANNSLMESAKGAGLYTAGVPPSLAARGGYTAMDSSYDGFGAGSGLTWRRLKSILESRMNS